MKARPIRFASLTAYISLCLFASLAHTRRGEAGAIPPPPWSGTGHGPTSDMQMLEYVTEVLPLLPERTFQELEAAGDRNADAGELQAIVYGARVRGDELGNHLVDFTNLDTYTNIHGVARLLKLMQELQALIAMYGDQWSVFTASGAGARHSSVMSLGQMLQALLLLDELCARADDPEDGLEDLTRYIPVFGLPGGAIAVHRKGLQLFRAGELARAEPLFELLLEEENINGFCRGNAYHFLASIARDLHGDCETAFKYYLEVHRHPACLVYTASSYFRAAQLLRNWNQHDKALALFMIDIPCIGFHELKAHRHLVAADICINRRDYTNAVRHLRTCEQEWPCFADSVAWNYRRRPECEHLAVTLEDMPWTDTDSDFATAKALASPRVTPDDERYADALLHEWPRYEDVPVELVTNRFLSNNIYE